MNEIISQKGGIYKIVNCVTGDLYIGQTNDFHSRKLHHFERLIKNTHHNIYLQRAWNKYGGENFEFLPIIICEKIEFTYYEQKCVDLFNPTYNIVKECVTSTLGFKMSDETKIKMSNAKKGRKLSEQNKLGISLARKGKHYSPLSEKHKENIRLGTKGKNHKPMSEETKRKDSEAHIGKRPSKEARNKMSLSQRKRRDRERIEKDGV
jgi:group I intron endonuclease